MKPLLFITRAIGATSPLQALSDRYRLSGQSLLRFEPVAIDNTWQEAAWLFFYSKRGVRFFSEQWPGPVHQRIGCIGPSTAQHVTALIGKQPTIIGSGDGKKIAEQLTGHLTANDQVAFFRAATSAKSVQRHLGADQVIDIVCYSNHIDLTVTVQRCDLAVLTSPLNAEAWLSQYPCDVEDVTIIAIGKTTGQYLESLGVTYYVSTSPTEAGIADTISGLT